MKDDNNSNSFLNIQYGGKGIKPNLRNKKPGFGTKTAPRNENSMGMGMGMGKSSMMSYKAQEKQQELEMKKQAEGEPDLGYIGSFSGMKCGELNDVEDRLECHYSKLKYDDSLARKDIKRKALQNKRQDRHKYAIQRMCMEEEPLLCSQIDRDELPKEPEPKCMEYKACPEPSVELMDIIKDFNNFYYLLLKSFSFKKSIKKKRSKNTKNIAKLRKKMKKELDDIKKEYNSLLQDKGSKTAVAPSAAAPKPAAAPPAPPAAAPPAAAAPTGIQLGGSHKKKRNYIYKKSRKGSTRKHTYKSIHHRKSHKINKYPI